MEFQQLYYNCDSIKQELLACRICIATNVKLLCLQNKLAEYYEEITGLQISSSDELPQHICGLCAAQLRRAAEFRTRSLHTHSVLLNISHFGSLTPDILQHLNLNQPKSNLSLTITEIIDYPQAASADTEKHLSIEITESDDEPFVIPETIEQIVIEEVEIKKEDQSTSTTNTSVVNEVDKELERTEDIKEDDLKIKNVSKQNHIEDTFYDDIDSSVKEYCVLCLRTSSLETKKQFCQYILDKYIEKNLSIKSPLSLDDIDATKDPMPTQIEEEKLVFYEFIKQKYIDKKEIKRKPISDVVRCPLRAPIKTTKKNKTKAEYENFEKECNCTVTFLLKKEDKIAMMEKRKDLKTYKEASFRCELCYKGFLIEASYNNHMKRSHDVSAGPHVCDVCHVRFQTRRALTPHASKHHVLFTCNICKMEHRTAASAKMHYYTHTGKEYPCEVCGKTFTRYKTRMEHMRTSHGSQQCGICYAYFTAAGFPQHLLKAHKETFPCSVCEAVFFTASARDRHTQGCPHGTPCTRCGESLPTEDEWRRHVNTQHSRAKMNRKTNYSLYPARKGVEAFPHRFMCEICAKRFAARHFLEAHQRIHTGEKPFQCSICPKKFRIKICLQKHERTHTGERPYVCSECGKAFTVGNGLWKHQELVHKKVRRFRCQICDNTFQTKDSVTVHVNSVHLKIPNKPRIRKRKPKASLLTEEIPTKRRARNKRTRDSSLSD